MTAALHPAEWFVSSAATREIIERLGQVPEMEQSAYIRLDEFGRCCAWLEPRDEST